LAQTKYIIKKVDLFQYNTLLSPLERWARNSAEEFNKNQKKMSKVNLVIVATINQNEKEALSHYLGGIGKLYEEVNAKSVAKYNVSKASIGDYTPNFVSIMQFENIVALNQVFDSQTYQALLPYRDKAFLKVEAYISE
jgi:uncharacterized protein (DUF1330 family)